MQVHLDPLLPVERKGCPNVYEREGNFTLKGRRIMTGKYRALAISSMAVGFLASAQLGWAQENWKGNLNLSGGFKYLDSDWKPADDQKAFGIQGDIRVDTWPINLFAAYTYGKSNSESVEIPSGGAVTSESRTDEFDIGVRKYFERHSAWRPFIGGGLAMLRGELQTNGPLLSQDDSDTAVGVWAGAGALYVWNGIINTGFQAKYSTGDVDLNGQSLNAGGIQLSALVGVHF